MQFLNPMKFQLLTLVAASCAFLDAYQKNSVQKQRRAASPKKHRDKPHDVISTVIMTVTEPPIMVTVTETAACNESPRTITETISFTGYGTTVTKTTFIYANITPS